MKKYFTLLLLFLNLWAFCQNPDQPAKILAGPMLGYSEHTECLVWVQTKCATHLTLKYRLNNSQGIWMESQMNNTNATACLPFISKFILSGLTMGSTYEYQIFLDGVIQKFSYPLLFKTKVLWEWRSTPPDFAFLLGSCLYINDSAYDRPGTPYGGNTHILKTMTNTPADFMLWLGDNTYTREADYSSASGIQNRYLHTRKEPALQEFLAKMNHYATWDDHDYGDNDANRFFEFKEVSRNCFKDYWGNKNFGEAGQGVYHNFRFSDAEFILLDDRWFRDESELNENFYAKTQLGSNQMAWLKNKLKHSRASFKFVVVGGQFINENTDKESYNLYKKEREEILQFIVSQKISGVIFLSGDRHHTELLKNDNYLKTLGYPLYDLTSSSITAGVSNILKTSEKNNPQRVANTLVVENNFCQIKISGPKRGDRQLTISCFDATGLVKWGLVIKESELKAKE